MWNYLLYKAHKILLVVRSPIDLYAAIFVNKIFYLKIKR